MATITLKNIPEPTYKTLKHLAAENHRSINSEVLLLIEKATQSTKIDAGKHLIMAKRLREKTENFILTDIELAELRSEGRP